MFRKILKGFKEQESVLVDHQLRIQSLETRFKAAKPKKRRKVKTNSNSKFVNIEDIQKAQKEAREVDIEEEASDIANLSDSTLDCIEIE